MKSLFSNLWKGPITSVMGLALFALTMYGLWIGQFDFMWNGAALLVVSVALATMSDKQVKGWVTKVFGALLDAFKKGAPILALVILTASCGVIKNVNRSKTKTDTDSTATAQVKTDTSIKEDKTTVTTIEADTSATIKGSEIKGSTPVKELEKRPIVLEDENQKVTVWVDSLGRAQVDAKVKDRKVDLKFRKRIEEKVFRDSHIASKSKSKVDKKEAASSSTTDKQVERKPFPWLVVLIILVVLIGFVWRGISSGWLPPVRR